MLVGSYMKESADPTVTHLSMRLRRHMCRKLDAEYICTGLPAEAVRC
jgi:hypothetical protein